MTDRPCFLKKLVCGVLTVTITALPFPHVVWAGDNSDTKELKKGSGSSMSYKGINIDGSTFFPDSNKIDTSRLFPDSTYSKEQLEKFPDSTYSKEQLEKLDSDEALKKHGLNAQSALYEDASSANPTAEGSAYKIIADSRKNLSRKDLSNDSVTDTAKKVFALMDEDETFGKVFGTTYLQG